MSRIDTLKKAKELIDLVLLDLGNLKAALDSWPQNYPEDHNLLKDIEWHLIYIGNDADIRSRETSYEMKQVEHLRSLMEKVIERIKLIENEATNGH
jgi:cob(I)alamin adenosyltransferase